ncbi:hypothetical protein BDBG_05889 [Blastomyces gilchristii SLH14081]|uniref:Uncharacterized protein n=2 Tax=Blastomyces TaxID=229219 RepID=A0A179UT59_BLAGS|nr:uncharacterized protein BDBG_05889 [Blastomyces gilchristii SLH14081]EGE83900.1 hypothetical protein BDDG_06845 [Blastomyces dermatitidis ATCC 18188]OAT10221.1 hypothetical protein BDBG_05889 [Blastomyces gilchristii SLH14081]
MGCGSSKVQRDNDPPGTSYNKPRPATRPNSHRTQSQRRLATGTGARNRTQPLSAVPKPHSSSQPRTHSQSTSSRTHLHTGARTRPSRTGTRRRHPTALGTIHDGQPPEDSAIREEINSFRLFIDQHAINFYRTQCDESGASISRYIARTIISNVIEKRSNENSVAMNLASALEKYANDATSQKRGEHLLILCRTASMIGSMMDRHPESWEFSWRGGVDIVFPSVMRGHAEFMQATLDI